MDQKISRVVNKFLKKSTNGTFGESLQSSPITKPIYDLIVGSEAEAILNLPTQSKAAMRGDDLIMNALKFIGTFEDQRIRDHFQSKVLWGPIIKQIQFWAEKEI